MKSKGEFIFPDISITCNYNNFPEIYCNIDDILKEIYIQNKTWKWKIETERVPFDVDIEEGTYTDISGIRYNSKVSHAEGMSKEELDNNIFNEISKVMNDFLGMREIVFYDNGTIRRVEKDGLTRDYEFFLKEDQIEEKEIDAIYHFQHPINFNCEYSKENGMMNCEFLRAGKGYVPIYKENYHIYDFRVEWILKGINLHFNIDDLKDRNENVKIIPGFQYKSRISKRRGSEEELEVERFKEFDQLMQFIFGRKQLIDSETTIKLKEIT